MVESTSVADVFRMPALGADMTEGRVIEWLVREGDSVDAGDLVAVIETDKSDIEVEVFDPCTFERFLVEPGELVPVGEPLAEISRAHRVTAAGSVATAPVTQPAINPVGPSSVARPAEPHARPRISPRARRLAASQVVDAVELAGDRVVVGADVIDAVGDTSADLADSPADRRRAAIAERMEHSWREIPHYHVGRRIDVTDVAGRIAAHNEARPLADRVVLGAVLALAVARATAERPAVNGWWRDGGFVAAERVDLGMVVSMRSGGIVAVTIPDAATLDVALMMERMQALVSRVRHGRLRSADVAPSSISITSMGDRGAETVAGLIFPPQVALVGLGAPHAEPMVVDGSVAVRLVVHVTVAGDHRAHDGLVAAGFIDDIEAEVCRMDVSPAQSGAER